MSVIAEAKRIGIYPADADITQDMAQAMVEDALVNNRWVGHGDATPTPHMRRAVLGCFIEQQLLAKAKTERGEEALSWTVDEWDDFNSVLISLFVRGKENYGEGLDKAYRVLSDIVDRGGVPRPSRFLQLIQIEFGDEPRAKIGDAGGLREDDRPNDEGVPVDETHNGPPNYPPPEVPEELLRHGPNELDLDPIDLAPIVVGPPHIEEPSSRWPETDFGATSERVDDVPPVTHISKSSTSAASAPDSSQDPVAQIDPTQASLLLDRSPSRTSS